VYGPPAWKPHAILAELTSASIAWSAAASAAVALSPRSALRSIDGIGGSALFILTLVKNDTAMVTVIY
jgi:hypothetical protein